MNYRPKSVVPGFLLEKDEDEKASANILLNKLALSDFYLSPVFIRVLLVLFDNDIYNGCFNQNFDFIQYDYGIGLPVPAEVFL